MELQPLKEIFMDNTFVLIQDDEKQKKKETEIVEKETEVQRNETINIDSNVNYDPNLTIIIDGYEEKENIYVDAKETNDTICENPSDELNNVCDMLQQVSLNSTFTQLPNEPQKTVRISDNSSKNKCQTNKNDNSINIQEDHPVTTNNISQSPNSSAEFYDTNEEINFSNVEKAKNFIDFTLQTTVIEQERNLNLPATLNNDVEGDPKENSHLATELENSLLSRFDPFYNCTLEGQNFIQNDLALQNEQVLNVDPEFKEINVFQSSTESSNNPLSTTILINCENSGNTPTKIHEEVGNLGIDLEKPVTNEIGHNNHDERTLEKENLDTSDVAISVEHIIGSIIEEVVDCAENQATLKGETITESEQRLTSMKIVNMADVNDKLVLQEEENADLKLQLNASQQVRASLELQLRQKEEVIIKCQAETLRKEQAYKQEIKQIKEKLEEKSLENDNSNVKELQETIKTLKSREAKLISELNARKNDEQNYRKIMDEYEKTIGVQLSEMQKLNEEHETVKRHLANLELAFSDVHQKYERSKKIIDGYKCNEDTLRQTLMTSEDSVIKSEEKYESLKAHAKAQIEKSNQEMQLMRDQYDTEIHKLTAIIKRLEIKNSSLSVSLDQKMKECSALAALCDEVTGKV